MNKTHHENDDLWYAIEYNGISVPTDSIVDIIAEIPGENDEYDWWWVLNIDGKGFMLFSGGCDCTGWDCQSSVEEHGFFETALQAAKAAPEAEKYTKRSIKKWLIEQVEGTRPFGTWEEKNV